MTARLRSLPSGAHDRHETVFNAARQLILEQFPLRRP
jgi:hypothetical protein